MENDIFDMQDSERLKHWLRSIETKPGEVELPLSTPSSYDRDCESDSNLENLSDTYRRLRRRPSDTDSSQSIFSAGDAGCYTFSQSGRSMSGTDYTAGHSVGDGYRRQLKANDISEVNLVTSMDPDLDEFRLVFKPSYFSVQALEGAAKTVARRKLTVATKELTHIGNSYENKGLGNSEWPLHAALHFVIAKVIDPDNVNDTQRWPVQYIFDGASIWNRRPKCFAALVDLSQPKVDSMLLLPYTDYQPLLGKVLNGSYHHQSRQIQQLEGTLGSPEEVNELLSAKVMELLCTYEQTAEIVYCNTSKTQDRGDYVLTFWEFKKSEAEIEVCINQVVNAGVFLCGKQLDLILYAQSIQRSFRSVNPCSLGMAVTGRKWRIYLIMQQVDSFSPKPRFYYAMLAEGDWIDRPKCFLGAVVTMHEIMLDHTIKLLISCLKVITKSIKRPENGLKARKPTEKKPLSYLGELLVPRRKSPASKPPLDKKKDDQTRASSVATPKDDPAQSPRIRQSSQSESLERTFTSLEIAPAKGMVKDEA